MNPRLFGALDREWAVLTTTAAGAAPRRVWADDLVLGRYRDLDEIITALRAGASNRGAANELLAALARRAPSDDLAARTLLQAMLPGLVNVAKRIGHGVIDEELVAQVLTEAIDRIRTYPIERRPRAIAANITWDVFGRVARQHDQPIRVSDQVIPAETTADPSFEICELVEDALNQGSLRRRDARLLLSIAVGHDTIRSRAEREGVTYEAMNERWRRARNRLRLSLAA